MARTIKDHTNIYRFKVTSKGTRRVSRRGGPYEMEPYEEVKLVGPYTTKIAFQSWIDSSAHVKVERQQLMPTFFGGNEHELKLHWHTIETKYYEPETDDDA